MYLLNIQNFPMVRLEPFLSSYKPSYAILSHTWTDNEILFKDIQSCESLKESEPFLKLVRSHDGYNKVVNCCLTALTTSWIEHVWIDSCCIDKDSSANLSEAINSMYKWYESSSVCFVHLSDLTSGRPDLLDPDQAVMFENELRQCRWFTRGWTLQELIAPARVEFFNATWQHVGSKDDLIGMLAKITGIEAMILSAERAEKRRVLSECSVAKKFSWASQRETSRVEDQAYSLLGLFEINMPLLYGEGLGAFRRLQEVILATSNDQSILLWTPSGHRLGEDLFAPSPKSFACCGKITRCKERDHVETQLDVSKCGISMKCPVATSGKQPFAVLNCRYEDDFSGPILLPLIYKGQSSGEMMIAVKNAVWSTVNWVGYPREFRFGTLNGDLTHYRTSIGEDAAQGFHSLLLIAEKHASEFSQEMHPSIQRVNVIFRFDDEFRRNFKLKTFTGAFNEDTQTLMCNMLRGRYGKYTRGAISWLRADGKGLALLVERVTSPRYGSIRASLLITVLQPDETIVDEGLWPVMGDNTASTDLLLFLNQFTLQTNAGKFQFKVEDAMIMGDVVHTVNISCLS